MYPPSLRAAFLCASIFAAACHAQTAAVFTDFSPTIKQITYGTTRCTMWVGLAAYWEREVACYSGGTVSPNGVGSGGISQQVDAGHAGKRFVGFYPLDDNSSIGWIVKPTGEAEFSVMDPAGHKLLEQDWTFPPGN